MGTSLNVSAPPAMTTDAWPVLILSAAAQIAAFDEMHACKGIVIGRLIIFVLDQEYIMNFQ